MASQGPNACGTGANLGVGTWATPGNITADDGNYATKGWSGSTSTTLLVANNFGFSIPSGATIDGIVVEWKRKVSATNNSPRDSIIQLTKDGTNNVGTNKALATTWPTTEAYASYGAGTTDLWGLTWNDSEINAATFGCMLAAQTSAGKGSGVLSVNFCRITVYYTAGAAAGQPTSKRMGGVEFATRVVSASGVKMW